MVSEPTRVWFHKVVAMILYLAKRTKPECLTAVAYLATRVNKCTVDDVEKLQRLVRYIHFTRVRLNTRCHLLAFAAKVEK